MPFGFQDRVDNLHVIPVSPRHTKAVLKMQNYELTPVVSGLVYARVVVGGYCVIFMFDGYGSPPATYAVGSFNGGEGYTVGRTRARTC